MPSRRNALVVLLLALVGVGWGSGSAAAADHAYRVKDIFSGAATNPSSTPGQPVVMRGIAYFQASDEQGAELWRSDGTPSGTYRVKDIRPGIATSDPTGLTVAGDTLFFVADGGSAGAELWKSDGTPEGTTLVRDIDPGAGASGITDMVALGSLVLFQANDGVRGAELWRSDGTAGGTSLVKDLAAGLTNSFPRNLTVHAGAVYFAAAGALAGVELWRTDGTPDGTTLVKDIAQAVLSSSPSALTSAGDSLFFVANDGFTGAELWKTDGTEPGTALVREIVPGVGSPSIFELAAAGPQVFFQATGSGAGAELWRSDGTAEGTTLVRDIAVGPTSSSPRNLTLTSAGFLFEALSAGSGREIWRTDGTESGTQLVKDVQPGTPGAGARQFTSAGGVVFFTAFTSSFGVELWRTDGTDSGTTLVRDIRAGSADALPATLVDLDGLLLFSANNGVVGVELWRSDGTETGTALVRDIDTGIRASSPGFLAAIGDRLLFAATDGSGRELWWSDGTEADTDLLKEIRSGNSSSNPSELTLSSGELFFAATHQSDGTELWRSDGTAVGTVLVKDIADGSTSSNPGGFADLSGTLLFAATTNSFGRELWKTDGTNPGTLLVRDVSPGLPSSNPSGLVRAGAVVLFVAGDAARGRELWKTDGTAAGTVLVKDIAPGPASSNPAGLLPVGDQVYFAADDQAHGMELWKSDGTAAGTVQVADIHPAGSSFPAGFAAQDGRVYFVADDGVFGPELWASDGTASGTALVADLRPGESGAKPRLLTVAGRRLYLSADDGVSGRELWTSDGTSAGTTLVADLAPGPAASDPQALFDANGTLLFRANEPEFGAEPWSTDGTAGGTRRLHDINPGDGSSEVEGFTAAHGLLFFAANDGASGLELWAFENTPPVAAAGPDVTVELGQAAVLDASGSIDPDGDLLSFEWRDAAGAILGTEAVLAVSLPEGAHVLTLAARDGLGGAASDDVLVTVAASLPPEVGVIAPRAVTLLVGFPTLIQWKAADGGVLTRFDVFYSADAGSTFAPVPGCTALPATTLTCGWTPPSPATADARLRVEARDAAGNMGADESSFVLEEPALRLTAPNGGETWAPGTLQTIAWSTNLPANETVAILLSRDGGLSFDALAAAAPNSGSFSWLVSGPSSASAIVRLSWVEGSAQDQSDARFTINRAPLANAGPDVSAELGESVLLDGSATTDPDGDPLKYSWTEGTTPLGAGPSLSVSLPFGLHEVALTVQDAFGGVSTDTLEVRIVHTTTLELSVLGQNGGAGSVSVEPPGGLCDNAAGPDGACTFTYTDEPSVVLTATPAADSDFKGFGGACEGLAPCTLSLAERRTVSALFRHKNRAPVAVAGGPYTAARNVAVAFDGTPSTDADGDPLAYAWDFGDGSGGQGPSPSHAYAALGDYTVVLVVSDGELRSEPVQAVVQVVNRSPVAQAGPDLTVELGSAAFLYGSGSDPDGDPLSYEWSEGAVVLGQAPSLSVALPLGEHVLTLTVTDANGGAAQDTATVTVVDTTPPGVALVTPPEGFRFLLGRPASIAWAASDLGALGGFDVLVSADGGSFLPAQGCAALPGSARGCTWTAPGPVTAAGMMRLRARDASGNESLADAPFALEAAHITLTSPLAGANWGLGSTQTITFTHNLGPSATFRVQLSRSGGGDFEDLSPAVPSPDGLTGAFVWTVTGPATSSALVKVVWNEGQEVFAVTQEPVVIAPTFINLTTPNGGETWVVGSDETITFTHNLGPQAIFRIELSRSGGTSWAALATAVGSVDAGNGAFTWWVTGPGTSRSRIRVVWTGSASVSDRSDSNFVIR